MILTKIFIYQVEVKTEAILQLIPYAQLSVMLQRVPGPNKLSKGPSFQRMRVKFKRKVLEALFTSSI